jgi:hypothetical protein
MQTVDRELATNYLRKYELHCNPSFRDLSIAAVEGDGNCANFARRGEAMQASNATTYGLGLADSRIYTEVRASRSFASGIVIEMIRARAANRSRVLPWALRSKLGKLFRQDLSDVYLHYHSECILDSLGAHGASWQNHIFLRSSDTGMDTILHELTHVVQWLRFGKQLNYEEGSLSRQTDGSEIEARRCQRLLAQRLITSSLTVDSPLASDISLDDTFQQLLANCQIVGHASPRWKGAQTEKARIANNDVLADQRGVAVKKLFEPALRKALRGYAVQFRYDLSVADDDNLPDQQTMVIGTGGRGQRETIIAAKGNKFANDPQYKRVDLSVSISKKTTESFEDRVLHRYDAPTKTKFWYVSVAAGVGVYAGAGCSYLFIKLRNMYDQEASGSAYVCGGGVGWTPKALDFRKWFASASFGDEASFYTDDDVSFEDFHLRRIRYTSATIAVFGGYNWSYISFSNMGSGAQSISVGGPSLGGTDIGAAANVNTGLLFLFNYPPDYISRTFYLSELKKNTSQMKTRHNLTVYFPTQSAVPSGSLSEIETFAAEVANDILDQ